MFVGNCAKLNQGIAQLNDTVTIRAGDSTNSYILVEESSPELVCGELIGIGSDPLWEYEGWSHGDKIKVSESAVTAIIREQMLKTSFGEQARAMKRACLLISC